MKYLSCSLGVVLILASCAVAAENPVFKQLTEKGLEVSQGPAVQLPMPIMPDGLDAPGQRAAMEKVTDSRTSVNDMIRKSASAPVMVKVRNVRTPEKEEGPVVRSIDVWFVIRGDWDKLISEEFLQSIFGQEDSKSQVVLKSGVLNAEELAKRNLTVVKKPDYEEQFPYVTFSLLERVQLSATRFSVSTRQEDSILAAGAIDPRFNTDPEYPNQWRAMLRDERAEIKLGPPHLFAHGGGYAKITRLKNPADAAFVECHIVYEEDYGWFDGANLVKSKAPLMIQEKVRTFRRKLALASEKGDAKGEK